MAKTKPVQARLSDLTPGQLADFFALLADKTKGVTREGKPYYACRFRDARRTVAFMVWGDGPWFAAGETDWHPGQFYKLRAVYGRTRTLRPADHRDRRHSPGHGRRPCRRIRSRPARRKFARRSRNDVRGTEGAGDRTIVDEPLRKLVLTLLDNICGAAEAAAGDARPLPPVRRRPARAHPVGDALVPCIWRSATPPTIRI